MPGVLPPNYDEALVGDYVLPPLAVAPSKTTVSTADEARAAQAVWREVFAQGLFGELPPAPMGMTWSRHELPDHNCERISIRIEVDDRSFSVDAALWLPADIEAPVAVVVGLDFLGPLGTLPTTDYPLDPDARVALPQWVGEGQGPLQDVMRGTSAHRFPVPLLLEAGYAVLTSCYGSWVPDDGESYRTHGLWALLGLEQSNAPPGVLCLWSWALQRLVDIAAAVPEIDASRIVAAGHSRLGKAALWAAATDTRISALFLNESGCGGAALSRRNFGETLAHNRDRFPHWLLPEARATAANLDCVDQYQLLAQLAPRRLYVASAAADLWCDPRGEYLGLKAASAIWAAFGQPSDLPEAEDVFAPGNALVAGSVGWHLRPGGHELTPYDWARCLAFMAVDRG